MVFRFFEISDHFLIFNHELTVDNWRATVLVLKNGKSNHVTFTGLVRPQIN